MMFRSSVIREWLWSTHRGQMLIILALLLAELALILYGLYAFFPKQAGMLQAKIDIWRGHFEIRGCSFHNHPEQLAELFASIGVEYRIVLDEPSASDYAGLNRILGYNAVMYNAILQKIAMPPLCRDPKLLDTIKSKPDAAMGTIP